METTGILLFRDFFLLSAKFTVYVSLIFLLIDVLTIKSARKNKVDLESKYFIYHKKNGLFSSPIFKFAFWIGLFYYVDGRFLLRPLLVELCLGYYIFVVIRTAIELRKKMQARPF